MAFCAGPNGFSLSDKRTSEDDVALAGVGKKGSPPSATLLTARYSRLVIVFEVAMNSICDVARIGETEVVSEEAM
jgi:hypothetical protein